MPQMLGKEVALKMQAIEPDAAVLYMSGYAWPVLATEGRLDPDVIVVEKPFSAVGLLARAGEALTSCRRELSASQGTRA